MSLHFVGGNEYKANFSWIANDSGPGQIEIPFNTEFMGCVTGSQAFPQAYAHALAGDMLRRREELSSLCPYDDRWFLSRFGMNIFAGEGR